MLKAMTKQNEIFFLFSADDHILNISQLTKDFFMSHSILGLVAQIRTDNDQKK